MAPDKLELRFRDGSGREQSLHLAFDGSRADRGGIFLAARREVRAGLSFVFATVSNRGDAPVRLESIRFSIATGFPADAPARFFKHGYQSWSASGPVAVGTFTHRHDDSSRIARVNHQSEVIRPQDAPEGATSEHFTIVESESSHERFIAGFIGAAHQLSTVTVRTPNQVTARVLLDDVVLGPGEERESERLVFWHSEESASAMAARFAELLGKNMGARVGAPYQRGWCSWYHYFHDITEDAMRSNLRALKTMREDFPIDVVQLDDGYQAALGDWDRTNAKFPSGLKALAREIRDAGFIAGLWTAPFFAARDSQLMREHPGWFIRHGEAGEPLRAGYNPNWATGDDKYAYALDPSHPEFASHLERLFRKIVEDFGYDYLKLDFLYAAAAEGVRHDLSMTRAETLRHGLEAIRHGTGERTFILGCGCPLGTAVGIVDGMRIGPDVAPYWGASAGSPGDPGTAVAIEAILARSFMHRRWWLNDPDCLMLRAKETRLTNDERAGLAWTIAASGGMLLVSDDMNLLDAARGKFLQQVAEEGLRIDEASKAAPPLLADLLGSSPVRILSTTTADGEVCLLVNLGDEPRSEQGYDLAPHFARIVKAGSKSGAAL